MRFLALACDYDGTIAHHGRVDQPTIAALERVRASGRKLVLVTGRQLDDLKRAFERLDLFDCVIAENGALIYSPSTRAEQPLGAAPPVEFVSELQRRGVSPLSTGRVIVATWEPHDRTVHDVIREMGLELQVIFNKGAVMVLPSGFNKAVGLKKGLEALKLSPHSTVGVGDAENDHAFLAACECAVAVENALPSVKAHCDWVTPSDHGAGVIELIDRLIDSDLADLSDDLTRHFLTIGRDADGNDVRLSPYGGAVLVAGPSGAGKTNVTTALLERLSDADYQFAAIDPEGDYHEFPDAIALRGSDTQALQDDVMQVLDGPSKNVVVTLLDLRLEDRPEFIRRVLPRLFELRSLTARPHWIVIDEAHHLMPSTWQPSTELLPAQVKNLLLVTVHPDHVSRAILQLVDTLVVVGQEPQATLDAFAQGRGEGKGWIQLPSDNHDAKLAWLVRMGSPPVQFHPGEPSADRRRHQRKYAAGELGEDRSFYFRGPDGRLNLRAQNLEMFMQMADGVDDETWGHHLQQHDISNWFREMIKDEELADEAAKVESQNNLSGEESRARIRAAIESRYTTPA